MSVIRMGTTPVLNLVSDSTPVPPQSQRHSSSRISSQTGALGLFKMEEGAVCRLLVCFLCPLQNFLFGILVCTEPPLRKLIRTESSDDVDVRLVPSYNSLNSQTHCSLSLSRSCPGLGRNGPKDYENTIFHSTQTVDPRRRIPTNKDAQVRHAEGKAGGIDQPHFRISPTSRRREKISALYFGQEQKPSFTPHR